jgi:hypothetical protein
MPDAVAQPMDRTNPSVANWRAFNDGWPWLESAEFPFFTDAWITGEITLGPYSFLNTVAASGRGEVKRGVILRYAVHREWEYPSFQSTDATLYHGGSPAEELAALASLCLGVRLRAGRSTRRFQPHADPKGSPEEIGEQVRPFFQRSEPPVLPRAVAGQHPIDQVNLLPALLSMGASRVNALVRAARLYQDALWLCESEPAIAWLLLVSAVEAIANEWNQERGDPVERLKFSKPDLFRTLESHFDSTLLPRIAAEFADTLGSTQKFVKFCLEHLPPAPFPRPAEWAQFPWSRTKMREALSKIYEYRSRALHDGRPFPAPMCSPPGTMHEWNAPAETMTSVGIHQGGSTWLKDDVPFYLHIFEYIARGAILEWWRQEAGRSTAVASG